MRYDNLVNYPEYVTGVDADAVGEGNSYLVNSGVVLEVEYLGTWVTVVRLDREPGGNRVALTAVEVDSGNVSSAYYTVYDNEDMPVRVSRVVETATL